MALDMVDKHYNDAVSDVDADKKECAASDVLVSINHLIEVVGVLLSDLEERNDFLVGLYYVLKDAALRLDKQHVAINVAANIEARSKYRKLYEGLTKRERDVLKGIVDGRMNKVIAYELNLSVKSIEACRSNVKKKMQANSIAELVRMVIKEEALC